MGAPHGKTRSYHVSFGNHLFQRPLDVRKALSHHPDDFAVAHRPTHWLRASRHVEYSFRRDQLFCQFLAGRVDELRKSVHQTLTRATTGVAGITAKAFIASRINLEAKRLLAHTSSSVATIADSLGFDDPSNFVKFFKRETGCTHGVPKRPSVPVTGATDDSGASILSVLIKGDRSMRGASSDRSLSVACEMTATSTLRDPARAWRRRASSRDPPEGAKN